MFTPPDALLCSCRKCYSYSICCMGGMVYCSTAVSGDGSPWQHRVMAAKRLRGIWFAETPALRRFETRPRPTNFDYISQSVSPGPIITKACNCRTTIPVRSGALEDSTTKYHIALMEFITPNTPSDNLGNQDTEYKDGQETPLRLDNYCRLFYPIVAFRTLRWASPILEGSPI